MNGIIIKPDYFHYKGLPNRSVMFNPLTDTPFYYKEKNEITEFYKLGNEYWSPEFGIKYLLNINLYPFQMSIIRSFLQHSFPLLLMTRGGGKTFLLAVYSIYRAIYMPGSKIVLVSAGFRQAKNIFNEIRRIYEKSPLLKQISSSSPNISVDRCKYELHGSSIVALPLGDGEKIRGERANIILVDEFDSIPTEVFDVVVRGFAAVELNPWHKTKSIMIGGDKRRILPHLDEGNQILLSGTARFKNGPMYRMYNFYNKVLSHKMFGFARDYSDILGEDIDGEQEIDCSDYCIIRIKYDELPPGMLSEKVLNNAKTTMSKMYFNMEYNTIFADDTQGYFKARDIYNATSKLTDSFSFGVLLSGKHNRTYVLGVDPARSTDRFAICVIEIGSPNKIVYSWTCQDKPFSYATKKIRELLRKFKIIAIAMDAGGGGLAVEELLWQKDLMKEGDLAIYRHDNEDRSILASQKILYMFDFTTSWIEDANALLQKNIEDKVIMFPLEVTKDTSDDIEDTLEEIREMKKELTSIEVTYTKTGKKHFDLMPSTVNISMGEVVKHKDRYSALLLCNYLSSRMSQLNIDKNMHIKSAYNSHGSIGGWVEEFVR